MSKLRLIEMSFTRDRAAIKEAESEASREIQAAQTLGEIEHSTPPFFDGQEAEDAWYLGAFNATEQDLKEIAEDAAREYHEASRWTKAGRRRRREARAAYIRAEARRTAASGLETTWM